RIPRRPRRFAEGEGEMTGPRPAGRPWTLTDDDMLRKLLTSGINQRLIAQKMKRSIGAIQSRISLFKKPRKRLPPKHSCFAEFSITIPRPGVFVRAVLRSPSRCETLASTRRRKGKTVMKGLQNRVLG